MADGCGGGLRKCRSTLFRCGPSRCLERLDGSVCHIQFRLPLLLGRLVGFRLVAQPVDQLQFTLFCLGQLRAAAAQLLFPLGLQFRLAGFKLGLQLILALTQLLLEVFFLLLGFARQAGFHGVDARLGLLRPGFFTGAQFHRPLVLQFGFPTRRPAVQCQFALFQALVESQVLFLQFLLVTRSCLPGLGLEPAFEFEFLAAQLFLRQRLRVPELGFRLCLQLPVPLFEPGFSGLLALLHLLAPTRVHLADADLQLVSKFLFATAAILLDFRVFLGEPGFKFRGQILFAPFQLALMFIIGLTQCLGGFRLLPLQPVFLLADCPFQFPGRIRGVNFKEKDSDCNCN